MPTILRLQWLILLLYVTSLKCTAVEVNEFENEEAIADQAMEADFLNRNTQDTRKSEDLQEEQQDSDALNGIDEQVFLKPKTSVDVSEEIMQQAVAEAKAEVEKENQQNEIADAPQKPKRVNYQGMHYRAKDNPEAELKGVQARVMEKTMKKIANQFGLSSKDAVQKLSGLQSDYVKRRVCRTRRIRCNRFHPYRTLNGFCNNILKPSLGAANTPFKRLLLPDYADGISEPRESKLGCELVNTRVLSRKVFAEKPNTLSKFVTHLLMTWGQFMDHDMTLAQQPQNIKCPSGPQRCVQQGECFGIRVPRNDPDFQGTKCIRMKRDVPAPNRDCRFGPRQQINTLTAFIDASHVYGSSRAALREVIDPNRCCGLLKVSNLTSGLNIQPLLPPAPEEAFCETDNKNKRPCFIAGDIRVNENQGLASIHTLFMREHNRIAKKLKKINNGWSGCKIFQEARKIVGAMLQHITYNEFLPIVLNYRTRRAFGLILQRRGFYRGYSLRTDPSVSNSFSAAAFRFGHSLVRNDFSRFGKSSQQFASIATKNFDNPTFLYNRSQGGVDSIIRGLTKDNAERFDRHFVRAITAKLMIAPHVFIDLPATNVQRGREHGLPGYNHFRRLCGLKKAKSFTDLKREFLSKNIFLLKKHYDHVDDIDLFAGGVMEKPLRGALVGPIFSCIIAKQFRDLRRGDRFWYERFDRYTGFTPRQLRELRKVSLARVICDNSDDIKRIQRRVMWIQRGSNRPIDCSRIPEMNLRPWKDFRRG